MTLTSASPARASMPSKVLLPTPAGENIPMRCPSPMQCMASTTRMPVAKVRAIIRRCSAPGDSACTGTCCVPTSAPLPSSGAPKPSSTRPRSALPTAMEWVRPVAMTCVAVDTPRMLPNGTSSAVCLAKPTTSANSASSASGERSSHSSPMRAFNPATLITVPIASLTRARTASGTGLVSARSMLRAS